MSRTTAPTPSTPVSRRALGGLAAAAIATVALAACGPQTNPRLIYPGETRPSPSGRFHAMLRKTDQGLQPTIIDARSHEIVLRDHRVDVASEDTGLLWARNEDVLWLLSPNGNGSFFQSGDTWEFVEGDVGMPQDIRDMQAA